MYYNSNKKHAQFENFSTGRPLRPPKQLLTDKMKPVFRLATAPKQGKSRSISLFRGSVASLLMALRYVCPYVLLGWMYEKIRTLYADTLIHGIYL